jgi:putative transcriptional regulator
MYNPIEIDREKLTLLGMKFSALKKLENTANAIGSNMFEGFEPTSELIQLYVDWSSGTNSDPELVVRLHAIAINGK